jgi:hypothetical protein
MQVVGHASRRAIETKLSIGIVVGGASVLLPIIGREPDGQPVMENRQADFTNL